MGDDSWMFGEDVPHESIPGFGAGRVLVADAAPHALRSLYMTILVYSQLLLISAAPTAAQVYINWLPRIKYRSAIIQFYRRISWVVRYD